MQLLLLEINLRLTLVLIKGAAIVRIKCGEPSWGNIGGEHFHVRNAVRQFGDAVGGGNRRESACSEAVKCCLGTFISLQWLCLLFLISFFSGAPSCLAVAFFQSEPPFNFVFMSFVCA